MAKVPIQNRVSAYAPRSNYQLQMKEERYQDLHEGPINPRDITKNGNILFSFINQVARGVSETQSNELAVRGLIGDMKMRNSIYNSKIPDLGRVGKQMEEMMNQGERQRAMAQYRVNQQPTIQVNLSDLLNADKAFDNITAGYKKPVIQNNYTKEETKTMSDIDISEYLGGTPQRSAVQQNNTFYVNMDKTTKALLAEQVKTNKLLGVLVQTVRENGDKIDELPQHIAELVAANNLPDSEIMNDAEYDAATAANTSIDDLLP